MTDEVSNLILEQLRNIRADLVSFKTEVTQRLDALSSEVAAIKTTVAGLTYITANAFGEVDARLDRLERKA